MKENAIEVAVKSKVPFGNLESKLQYFLNKLNKIFWILIYLDILFQNYRLFHQSKDKPHSRKKNLRPDTCYRRTKYMIHYLEDYRCMSDMRGDIIHFWENDLINKRFPQQNSYDILLNMLNT
jgi:hypothetical protein